MNAIINKQNNNIINKDKIQNKDLNKHHLSILSNTSNNQKRYSSDNQRNMTKFNSQRKVNNNKDFLISLNDINNIKINNLSNLLVKTTKVIKKTNNKKYSLSKPKLEIEINNKNNKRIHYSRLVMVKNVEKIYQNMIW